MPRLNLWHIAHKKQVISILQKHCRSIFPSAPLSFSVQFSAAHTSFFFFFFPEVKSKRKYQKLQKPKVFGFGVSWGFEGICAWGEGGVPVHAECFCFWVMEHKALSGVPSCRIRRKYTINKNMSLTQTQRCTI